MKLIPIHKSTQVAKVDDEDYDRVSIHKWILVGNDTAVRTFLGSGLETQINMSNFILNTKDRLDHKDRNFLNNQKENLRPCTQSQNMANREKYFFRQTTSKYKGVYFNKEKHKWHARVKLNGDYYQAGYHYNENEAALAYNKLALRLFGEFAVMNVIE